MLILKWISKLNLTAKIVAKSASSRISILSEMEDS